jgi:hypothetical protein
MLFSEHHAMEEYWGSGDISPRILDFGTRWRWVVTLAPRPLYLQGKSPWYSLDRRLCGPQRRSGLGGEEKNSHALPGFKPRSPALYHWAVPALVCIVHSVCVPHIVTKQLCILGFIYLPLFSFINSFFPSPFLLHRTVDTQPLNLFCCQFQR